MNTTNFPYECSRLVFRRQLNYVCMSLENFNFSTSWVNPSSYPIFSVPAGYKPANEILLNVFAKNESTLASIGVYIDTAGGVTWAWGKTPSNSYTGSAKSLCCSGSWITNDAMPA